MKLVRAASHSVEPKFREVGGYKPGFFGWLFRLPIIKAELVPHLSRLTPQAISDCQIDFEQSPCTLNETYHQSVAFGDELYRNIVPVRHMYDNVYECHVGSVEIIRREKAYESTHGYYM